MRYLLDTSVVSAPAMRTPNARVVAKISRHATECAIAAPVWHELSFGAARLAAGKRRALLESYLRDVVHRAFPILPYDEQAATWHARERARLERDGTPARFVDGQIAAIAVTHDLVLVTANRRDFERFEGLRVEDWTRARASR